MRGVFTAWSPDNKDNSTAPHAQALQPQLAVVLPVIFHRDHREIEDRLEFSKIDSMFAEILAALRFIPRDHAGNVDANCS